MKKVIIIIITVILIITSAYIIIPGFCKIESVYVNDYSISKDSKKITLDIGIASSAGYARKVKSNKSENILSLDFYRAFGGINGSIGAKNSYTIELDEDIDTIAIYYGPSYYRVVLEKDKSGNWNINTNKY